MAIVENMRSILSVQVVRFFIVGCINTAFSYSIYATLLYIGMPFVVANFGALLLGILFSFRTQGRFVFNNRATRLIFRFVACWGVIFLINIAFIAMLIRAGLNAYWGGALALVPVTLLSYFVQRFLVFNTSR